MSRALRLVGPWRRQRAQREALIAEVVQKLLLRATGKAMHQGLAVAAPAYRQARIGVAVARAERHPLVAAQPFAAPHLAQRQRIGEGERRLRWGGGRLPCAGTRCIMLRRFTHRLFLCLVRCPRSGWRSSDRRRPRGRDSSSRPRSFQAVVESSAASWRYSAAVAGASIFGCLGGRPRRLGCGCGFAPCQCCARCPSLRSSVPFRMASMASTGTSVFPPMRISGIWPRRGDVSRHERAFLSPCEGLEKRVCPPWRLGAGFNC